MPPVSRCPKCEQYVSVPNDVSPAEQVRCPHCAAEFPLREAFGDPPPSLVPVVAADDEPTELIVGDTDDEAADLVTDEEVPALGAVDDEGEEGSPWAAMTAAAEPTVYDLRVPDGEQGEQNAAEPGMAAVYAEAFDFVPRGREEPDSAAAVATRLRQEAEKHSMFGELVKIILGGIVGLVIGYYLLNFFGGERFDRLPIYLPGCPHTYHHWPGGEDKAVEDAM